MPKHEQLIIIVCPFCNEWSFSTGEYDKPRNIRAMTELNDHFQDEHAS